jgi:hypothetical protein
MLNDEIYKNLNKQWHKNKPIQPELTH